MNIFKKKEIEKDSFSIGEDIVIDWREKDEAIINKIAAIKRATENNKLEWESIMYRFASYSAIYANIIFELDTYFPYKTLRASSINNDAVFVNIVNSERYNEEISELENSIKFQIKQEKSMRRNKHIVELENIISEFEI